MLSRVSAFLAGLPTTQNAQASFWREPVVKRQALNPAEAFETDRGGWLPEGCDPGGMSQTANDLSFRQACRKAGRLGEADLIRRVVEGGSIEVRDFPDGTLWIFGKGCAWGGGRR